MGFQALNANTASENVAVGGQALTSNTTGKSSTWLSVFRRTLTPRAASNRRLQHRHSATDAVNGLRTTGSNNTALARAGWQWHDRQLDNREEYGITILGRALALTPTE